MHTAIAAIIAITASKSPILLMPNKEDSCTFRVSPNIQHNAVIAKIRIVIYCLLLSFSVVTSGVILIFSLGRNTRYIVPNIKGIKPNTVGIPYCNHSEKLILSCEATMAFGGLPTKVPIPPILAL